MGNQQSGVELIQEQYFLCMYDEYQEYQDGIEIAMECLAKNNHPVNDIHENNIVSQCYYKNPNCLLCSWYLPSAASATTGDDNNDIYQQIQQESEKHQIQKFVQAHRRKRQQRQKQRQQMRQQQRRRQQWKQRKQQQQQQQQQRNSISNYYIRGG